MIIYQKYLSTLLEIKLSTFIKNLIHLTFDRELLTGSSSLGACPKDRRVAGGWRPQFVPSLRLERRF
ncbi:MAG: hypothetical protein COZ30_00785 [Candidatus Nealsonbacteria bacterium CG_4_10_14_3_um_filter_36_16]|uniref:Uncharacterized protein n=1 Tax=Candidatus Nealsonbacteria bacterium CG_4_10_14_3_um_filter_36_16 TaxID=1974685 RepID=A0A2M7MFC3_9BACT|nr:MAG: hypothetical protein COZ30_00785 [Candidatus Nealsonbacteria bacterium CG_4_10_14_3_um_filter_36_16]